MTKRSKLMRIDINLANQIEKIARDNELSLTQASKKISDITKNMCGKKIVSEFKI